MPLQNSCVLVCAFTLVCVNRKRSKFKFDLNLFLFASLNKDLRILKDF
jgi:hypothetical protein